MMKIFFTVLMVISMTFMFVTTALADLNDGLVAYYPFNGNANDESGSGNPGTVNGATLTTDRFGNAGSAYSFDGVDDLIEVPDNPMFHFTDQMTVAAWVNPSEISGLHTIVNKWYSMDSYMLHIENDNFNFVVVFPGGEWGQPVNVTTQATAGTWTHVASVFDGQRTFLYINGQLAASQAAIGTLQDSDRPISIGNHPSWNAFQGAIDEVRLYSRNLSASEIQELYNEGIPTLTISPASGSYVTTQGFDLTLIVKAPGLSVEALSATLDGSDVTDALVRCVIPGTLVSGGETFRCPGVTGGTFGIGIHTLEVAIDLSDGSSVSDTVTWDVKANIEN